MTLTDGGESGQTVTALDLLAWQVEPCGRSTRKGTPCTSGRNAMSARHGDHVFLSPACATHLSDEERIRRQAILDMEEAARVAAEPACWSWPVPADGHGPEATLSDFQQGRCGICGIVEIDMVDDHDHYTGFIRGRLCRGCNTAEGMSHMPIFTKYRERHPAAIVGVELVYYGPFWEYERDAGKFHGPRREDRDVWASDTSLRLGL